MVEAADSAGRLQQVSSGISPAVCSFSIGESASLPEPVRREGHGLPRPRAMCGDYLMRALTRCAARMGFCRLFGPRARHQWPPEAKRFKQVP